MFKKCLAWCDEYAEKLVLAIGLLLIIHIVFSSDSLPLRVFFLLFRG